MRSNKTVGKGSLLSTYRQFLPLGNETRVISLGEGFTPLVEAGNLSKYLRRPDLKIYLKLEGLNPTGSFKDRGMTMAITKAVEDGAEAVICASTGNTSASAAAFAAKAGLKCFVLLPVGNVALGKLAQAILYGATVIQVEGNFDQALDIVQQIGSNYPVTIVNSVNPYRLEGQKTGAFEVIESLGDAPESLCIPVGNAGNITAYYRGFKQWHEAGHSTRVPKMCGFQAEGAAPMVLGHAVKNPETIATAIRIGNPASWAYATEAIEQSSGLIDSVS
ncbi:MAG: threonine synthase, partial [Candidatus Obscuribacterales bacterium]|nr:threonine synthase [Candidatus Obscuribacterales bacterium]